MLEAVLSILAPVFDLVGLAGEATRRKRQVRVALTPIKNRLGLVRARPKTRVYSVRVLLN